ncbi:MAG: hypothetical protein ACOX6E_07115 [Syntrophomonadaceae bacterium]
MNLSQETCRQESNKLLGIRREESGWSTYFTLNPGWQEVGFFVALNQI